MNIKTSDGFIRIPVEKLKGKVKETPKEEKPEVSEPKPYVDDEDDGEELPF